MYKLEDRYRRAARYVVIVSTLWFILCFDLVRFGRFQSRNISIDVTKSGCIGVRHVLIVSDREFHALVSFIGGRYFYLEEHFCFDLYHRSDCTQMVRDNATLFDELCSSA